LLASLCFSAIGFGFFVTKNGLPISDPGFSIADMGTSVPNLRLSPSDKGTLGSDFIWSAPENGFAGADSVVSILRLVLSVSNKRTSVSDFGLSASNKGILNFNFASDSTHWRSKTFCDDD